MAYYQSWNVRNRACNKVAPRDLDTTGYTHLFYSFASINPATYRIAPAHADDPAMMREFTGLSKPGGLQTWIAIGGFDFSDEGTPTHTTWSDVCATQARRAAFISSVKDYMDEYGFQGVDLDWEYPGDARRGGNGLDDTRNLVLLVKEMRQAYGNAYGISLTLAPDYWYLRWFDPKAMEPYVDFFGFMAYDLHGYWDSDVLTLGKKVRGQADIREIADNTVPLWFDGLNPAKINFGLAMYGRGYKLADPTCNQLLCPFAGPSDPAPCTGSPGVMSLLEIQQLIRRKGLTPQYLADSMMKQITWDDQWIGYDDEETFAAKKAWADSRCFGGTMVWSIDFQVSGSGNSDEEKYGDVVYVGSEVFATPTAQCPAPCIMVFPTSGLDEPKTITVPPYTATLEVGTTTTTIVAVPSASTVTVTSIDFFNHYVNSEQQPGDTVFTLRPSFQPSPVTVTVTGQDGHTTLRTVLPPPLGGGAATGAQGNQTGGQSVSTLAPATAWPWVPPPTQTPEPDVHDDDNVLPAFPENYDPRNPSQTQSTGGSGPTQSTNGSGGIQPTNGPGGTQSTNGPNPSQPTNGPDGTRTTVTTSPNPAQTTSPPFPTQPTASIVPVTDLSKPVPPGGTRVRCSFWFFFICISWTDINLHVDWWDIVLPPGSIGPGPPPSDLLKLPPGWKIQCPGPLPCLPPWPKITVGPGGAFPSEPSPKPEPCKTTTATLTIETTSYGTTTTQGTVRTTTTRILSSEFPILGCAVTDTSTATTVTACNAKPTPTFGLRRRSVDIASKGAAAVGSPALVDGADITAARRRAPLTVRADEDSDGDSDGGSGEGSGEGSDEDCPEIILVDGFCTPENPTDEEESNEWKAILEDNADWETVDDYRFGDFTVVEATEPDLYIAFVFLSRARLEYLEMMENTDFVRPLLRSLFLAGIFISGVSVFYEYVC